MSRVEVEQGNTPVILAFPHTGSFIPDGILACLNDNGHERADTDWHIHQVYKHLLDGATTVRTQVHRYVIDVNRDPFDQSLYPGENTTTLCPTTDFDGKAIYLAGQDPDKNEIQKRCKEFHQSYHAAIQSELNRVKEIFGFAILYDCHSIRSEIPFLFEAKLPDFNIGTNSGSACHHELEAMVLRACESAAGYSCVLNGRFKGGWTTRHYGRPEQNQHAIQMELAQSTYMQEKPPWLYQGEKADQLRLHLKTILAALSNWRPK